MSIGNSQNGMVLNKSSLSMQPRLAADDDKIKFSEFDRGVETVIRYCALRASTSPARLHEIPSRTVSILTIWVTLRSCGPPCTRLQVRASLHVRGSG
jgi:hypothetical protein